MTIEEVKNNYEYKVTVKSLTNEFPWIKKVHSIIDPDKYASLIFLNVYIDITYLAKKYNLKIASYVRYHLTKGDEYSFTFLDTFIEGINNNDDTVKDIEGDIKKFMYSIHKSKALPEEMKLPKGLSISGWRAIPMYESEYPELLEFTKEDEDNALRRIGKSS